VARFSWRCEPSLGDGNIVLVNDVMVKSWGSGRVCLGQGRLSVLDPADKIPQDKNKTKSSRGLCLGTKIAYCTTSINLSPVPGSTYPRTPVPVLASSDLVPSKPETFTCLPNLEWWGMSHLPPHMYPSSVLIFWIVVATYNAPIQLVVTTEINSM